MKKIVFILAIFCLVSCTASSSGTRPSKELEDAVYQLAESYDRLAQASIFIGGDTETEWAADTVHSIFLSIKDRDMDVNEKLATIQVMQSYIAYGLNYFMGMMCLYHAPELASWALRGATPTTDSLYQELKATKFTDKRLRTKLTMYSLANMGLYLTMDDAMQDRSIFSQVQYAGGMITVCDSLYTNMKDQHQVEKICAAIEGVGFFQVYCSMINRVTFTEEEFYGINQKVLVPIANYFDAHSTSIHEALFDDKPLPEISKEEYQDFLLQSTLYKIEMIDFLVSKWEKIAEEQGPLNEEEVLDESEDFERIY